ncbi:hypothetical protein F5887DRAFT_1250822 [Amanita rubescens]|nr:hypothetical protein F5887DRAFT_1250822 [Amanita rubescens]
MDDTCISEDNGSHILLVEHSSATEDCTPGDDFAFTDEDLLWFLRPEHFSSLDITASITRVICFVPWCICVGGTMLLWPDKLEQVAFETGYMDSTQGIRRFAHWADVLGHQFVMIFLAFLATALWALPVTVGATLFIGLATRFGYVWRGFPSREEFDRNLVRRGHSNDSQETQDSPFGSSLSIQATFKRNGSHILSMARELSSEGKLTPEDIASDNTNAGTSRVLCSAIGMPAEDTLIRKKNPGWLITSQLPGSLWGKAICHAVWLKNRTWTRALLLGVTSFELLNGEMAAELNEVPVWGQLVWVHDTSSDNSVEVRGSGAVDLTPEQAEWLQVDELDEADEAPLGVHLPPVPPNGEYQTG